MSHTLSCLILNHLLAYGHTRPRRLGFMETKDYPGRVPENTLRTISPMLFLFHMATSVRRSLENIKKYVRLATQNSAFQLILNISTENFNSTDLNQEGGRAMETGNGHWVVFQEEAEKCLEKEPWQETCRLFSSLISNLPEARSRSPMNSHTLLSYRPAQNHHILPGLSQQLLTSLLDSLWSAENKAAGVIRLGRSFAPKSALTAHFTRRKS